MKKYGRKHIGEVHTTNEGYEVEIIDGGSKRGCNTCKIENFIFEARYSNVKKGECKYPLHKSVYNVGYYGIGRFKAKINGKMTKVYILWSSMISRCYNPQDKSYKQYGGQGVKVCDEWKNYQNFCQWYENYQYYKKEDWVLDKDLLSNGNNKIYCQ